MCKIATRRRFTQPQVKRRNQRRAGADALLTLHYDNGQKTYEMQQAIQPGDQMWVNVAELIQKRTADRKGNALPADLAFGTYEVKDMGSDPGGITVGSLALDKTFGYHSAVASPDCCGVYGDSLNPDSLWVDVSGFQSIGAVGTNQCTGQLENILADITGWSSGNTAIAQVASAKVTGVAPGFTTATGTGIIPVCMGNTLYWQKISPSAPVTVTGVPSGEITEFNGTFYQISAAQFLMTLEPSAYSYDNHSVKESSPVLGTNSCWWSGSGMVQYPVVQGSTWMVAQGGVAGHNQYGLDTVGFGSAVVALIQSQGAAHGVEFPCTVNIHQSMNYDSIDLYVTNLLTQTIGSTTVTVCRAGVCSGTIQW
jgi:hypothetical protein